METEITPTTISTVNQKEIIPDLSIILVCWNNKTYLEPCLKSLYEKEMHHTFDVIVVDNGSTDGSQEMLQEKFPQVNIIQNDHNLGLGKASNQGIVATTGKFILLLNNDTIVNGQSFDKMIDFMERNTEAGAVGGKLLNPDGSIQACFNKFSTLMEEFLIATRLGEILQVGYPSTTCEEGVRSVDWIGSACLMLRRTALEIVGLLDEEYFIYGDEADLQYRLKKAGWQIFYIPEVTTVHYGGRSMDRWRRRKMVYRGKLLFYQKNYGTLQTVTLRFIFGILSLAKLVVWSVALLLPGKRDQAKKEYSSNLEVIKLSWKLE
jgi:GT2 family glycosyltransferase